MARDDLHPALLEHVGHERAVDLQRRPGAPPQEGERRVAGAEVVDLRVHAVAAQPGEQHLAALGLGDVRTLGDLDQQRAALEAGLVEDGHDVVDDRAVGELAAGDVDRDGDVRRDEPGAAPRGELAQAVRSTLRPSGPMSPVSSAIGIRSPGGSGRPSASVIRSSASKPMSRPSATRSDRLVAEAHAAGLTRGAQHRLELQAGHDLLVHAPVEQLGPVAAGALGAVHRDVGVAHELARGRRRAADGDADAGRDEQGLAVELERVRERALHAIGDRVHRDRAGDLVEQDDELVAAEAGHRVAGRTDS